LAIVTSRTTSRDPASNVKAGSGASFRDCPLVCPELVVVPAGSFLMGSPEEEPERENWKEGTESPQVEVKFDRPFAAGKHAVTFEEWDACVSSGGCDGHNPGDQGWGRGRRPVINVDWNQAQSYTAWLSAKTGHSYRLLSEAEREYATRAGTTTPFWWGVSITPQRANYNGSAEPYEGGGEKGEYPRRTMPVDAYDGNPWGLFQVHGNVWEWTADCWNNTHTDNPGNGAARLTGECERRVVRGGAWYDNPRDLRAAFRTGFTVGSRNDMLGFRVARSIRPQS
jgi:formylglycine-generating enzyme required for sulfatase activity